MHSNSTLRPSRVAAVVASTLAIASTSAFAAVTAKGVVGGAYFTAPVISDSPTTAHASSTVASTYAGAKVCFDLNNNGVCDATDPAVFTGSDGSFTLTSKTAAPLVAEIGTTATNNGHPVASRNVFRVSQAQIAASQPSPLLPASVSITPISTEIARAMEADGLSYTAARDALASRLSAASEDIVLAPTKILEPTELSAVLKESVVDAGRFELAAKFVDRHDVSPTTQTPVQIKEAQQLAMNLESIPRYDNIFIIMLENKATLSIKGSAYAPKINALLNSGNQFVSYFATGNPSEPNYTALGGADDFGITDDNQWNCGATGANAVQDLVIPSNTAPGLASSPFTASCSQSTNHNITGRPNLFNALSSKGLSWRTYSESMNPGQDVRTDSVADSAVTAPDNVYAPGTVGNNTSTLGSATLTLPLPAGLYKTKHHPGMAYQNVRSAPEFATSNRTMGGGQWDANLPHTAKYAVPSNYDYDQLHTDLYVTGDIGNVNFLVPDQCDDMHGIGVTGTNSGSGGTTASDCSSVSNNVSPTAQSPIITRGDNYTDKIVKEIQGSPLWQDPNRRVAIVIMFDEGNATSGFNSCCGWNPGNSTVAKPLTVSLDGTSVSVDTSVAGYTSGNRGHGESIFGVLTNQTAAPKGIHDSDYYSHFSFVRTLQNMFGLSDPDLLGSYMNRSKYTEAFIAANLLNLPEYASSADTHFDSVRPMNHAYVFPASYTLKQSADVNTAAQTGPDSYQTNLWALK